MKMQWRARCPGMVWFSVLPLLQITNVAWLSLALAGLRILVYSPMTSKFAEQLQAHAAEIRASGILGRSELMLRLFNFLVSCAVSDRTPKEIEIALEVFGKQADFDVGQDAMVRVYMLKLRRKLDEYYASAGAAHTERLVLPKGEYRLVFRDQSELLTQPVETEDPSPAEQAEAEVELEALVASKAATRARPWRSWLWASAVTLLVVTVVAVPLLMRWTNVGAAVRMHALRSNPVWANILDDDLPVYVVVGDYYIFGELSDSSMEVQRLVREFNINSSLDLEQYLKNNPELAGRYMDMSLKYLPVSVAYALREVLPILESAGGDDRQVKVILASELTPEMVRSAHVVYIGLLSGMGILQKLVFDGSRFAIGESYDELVDLQTKKSYISQEGMVEATQNAYTDYGYFSSRTGVDGNQIVVIAGTRDEAMQYMAENMTRQPSIDGLDQQAGATQDFEALYSVKALEQSSIGGRLQLTHKFTTRFMEMQKPASSPVQDGKAH